MTKVIVAIIAILLLTGCSQTFTPVCRHNAVMAALVVGEKYPVRLAWGKAKGQIQNHVQTQAFIDDEWKYIKVSGGMVFVGAKDNYEIFDTMTIREFIDFEWGDKVR